MELIKSGNSRAFSSLLKRYNSSVYGLSIRMMGGNQAQAEDLTQEVWLKVARFAASYTSQGIFKSWLMTMTRNTALNEIRKQKNYQDHGDEVEEVPDQFDVVVELMKNHQIVKVRAAIDELPVNQRTALILRITEGLSLEAISKELDCTVGAVKLLIYRAKENLEKRLK